MSGRPSLGPRPVHPHACGESIGGDRYADLRAGSSPRVWGKPLYPVADGSRRRFIPTRVGKATRGGAGKRFRTVHPHCSSPRVWGKRSALVGGLQRLRFIPTRVGKAATTTVSSPRRAVHPHACGESPSTSNKTVYVDGSSPRVWGKLLGAERQARPQRFIPTRVGKALPM